MWRIGFEQATKLPDGRQEQKGEEGRSKLEPMIPTNANFAGRLERLALGCSLLQGSPHHIGTKAWAQQ